MHQHPWSRNQNGLKMQLKKVCTSSHQIKNTYSWCILLLLFSANKITKLFSVKRNWCIFNDVMQGPSTLLRGWCHLQDVSDNAHRPHVNLRSISTSSQDLWGWREAEREGRIEREGGEREAQDVGGGGEATHGGQRETEMKNRVRNSYSLINPRKNLLCSMWINITIYSANYPQGTYLCSKLGR